MKRRDFIRNLALGGMTLGLGSLSFAPKTWAAPAGRYFVFVKANGGWDVTSMWDPKGKEINTYRGPCNHYSAADIRRVGNIRYAPVPPGVETLDMLDSFTRKHYRRMMVINGVDLTTNSHKVGTRVCMTGSTSQSMPSMPAMLAAPFADSQPMAYIGDGGYTYTAGVVPRSGLMDANSFGKLASPDKYMNSEAAVESVNQGKRQALSQLLGRQHTERRIQTLEELAQARSSGASFDALIDRLPSESTATGSKSKVELIAASFAAGWSTTASMGFGGFDTHGGNDGPQFNRMDTLLANVDYLWDQLEYQGIAEQTTVVLCSDLGRTPGYNNRDGKDHWSTSSMVFMGAGVPGNTVIGQTNDKLRPLKLDPNTLEPSESGILTNSASIYKSFRRMTGVQGGELDRRFPLTADYMNIFG